MQMTSEVGTDILIREIDKTEIYPNKIDSDIILQIMQIEEESFENGIRFSKEKLHALLMRSWGFNAIIKSRIVGYISAVSSARTYSTHIQSIAVSSMYRCKGIGNSLMSAVINKAEEMKQSKNIFLECRPHLENFYKKIGFETYDSVLSFYSIFRENNAKIRAPAICMRFIGKNPKNIMLTSVAKSNLLIYSGGIYIYKDNLINFTSQLKTTTSWWCNNFFLNSRKKRSFEIIEAELLTIDTIDINKAVKILQAILYNALYVRGLNKYVKTNSGINALNLLNLNTFKCLNEIIRANLQINDIQELEYNHLLEFTDYYNINEDIKELYHHYSY